ncbi:hypothetical protein FRC01_014914 [Tulasnella sp. 417]|nr:hypothetical protein FRC01_014914 [Tulasnella sp. 417]
MFSRSSTEYTLETTKTGSALWKVIHAVIDASLEGGLTTREVENDIRWHFPEQRFTRANVRYSLSHSRDFRQVVFGGNHRRRWTLTGKSDGVKRKNVKAVRHTPTTFVRRFTHFNLHDMTPKSSKFSMWKGCHAVLNASDYGHLTTSEVEEALRPLYPNRTIKKSTISNILTLSKDFRQVYPDGKTPGRWFLTGEVNGISRTKACQGMETCMATSTEPAGDVDYSGDHGDGDGGDSGDDDAVTLRDTPPAAELPYPSKTEEMEAQYSPDSTFSSPRSSPPLPISTKIAPMSLLRSDGQVSYYQSDRCRLTRHELGPAPGTMQTYQSPHFESQLRTISVQQMPSPVYPNNYTSEEYFTATDGLPALSQPPPPPYSLSENDQLWSDTCNTTFRNTNGVEPYLPPTPYPGNSSSNPAETLHYIALFNEGNISTSFPWDNFVWGPGAGELQRVGITETNAATPVYSPAMIDQQGVLNVYRMHMMARPTYTENTPCSGSYNSGAVYGYWNALEENQAMRAVATSEPPFGESLHYPLS